MKTLKINLILSVGSVILTLGLCELILRMLGIASPRFYQLDPILGYRLQANAEGWFRQEGESYIRINRDGWRDREHVKMKPPGVFRLAVLGDSYTEAMQLPLQETFWAVMEHALNARQCFGAQKIEALNFGVSGYGTAQELLVLQHDVWDYDPDIIVLAFLTGNDIRNNSQTLEIAHNRPFFVLRNGMLELDSSHMQYTLPSRLERFNQTLYQHARLYQLLSNLKNPFKAQVAMFANSHLVYEHELEALVYAEPVEPVHQSAWEVTEALLLAMRDDVRRHQRRFVVATLSNAIQVHPDADVRQQFMEQLDLATLWYPERRIQHFLEAHGVEVVTLAPLLHQYAAERQCFLHGFSATNPGFGHWNSTGHAVAGELLTQYFCHDYGNSFVVEP